MKHENYKELLELNILGELNEKEEIELQNHLFECNECKEEYAQLKKMYSLLSTERPAQPTEQDLINARVRLFNTINAEEKSTSDKLNSNSVWNLIFLKKFNLAFGSIALVLIGLFLGYFLFYNNSPQLISENIIDLDKIDKGDLQISKINLPDKYSDNTEFEFLLGDEQPINYRGNLNDIIVQKLLAIAITKTENPGFKIRTADAVSEYISNEFIPDEKIKEAFIHTLKADENPGVRKGAIKALVNFPYDDKIRDALLYILDNDDNASNRMDAISALLAMKYELNPIDLQTKSQLEDRITKEDNEVIKYKTAKYIFGGK